MRIILKLFRVVWQSAIGLLVSVRLNGHCSLIGIFNVSGSLLPQRVVMGIMGFLAIAVAYTIRACLSVAIVKMVKDVEDGGGKKTGPDVN